MHARELWHSPSVKFRLARAGLLPASWLYGLGWEIYLAAYRLGFKKPRHPHRTILCVGNLQVGGSGKTPVTRYLAKHITSQGRQVVISSSGYGSPRSERASLAPSGPLSASEWGDEAAMLRWLEPEIPLIVGRARVRAAEIAHLELPDHLLLLDDGFQHLPLKKDLTILLDPRDPPNRACLPAGPYREPRFNRNRADLLIPGDIDIVQEPTRLMDLSGESVKPDRYSVLCALGNPQGFLNDLNAHVPSSGGFERVLLKPDHDALSEGTLLDSFPRQIPVVVTAKDWVKLRERSDLGTHEFLVASQEIRLEPIEIIERWLINRTGN